MLIHTGDCLDVMAGMADASVAAVVTDPPYGLEFMGKGWDKFGAAVFHDPSKLGGYQDGNGGNAYSRSRVQFHNGLKAMLSYQAWCEAWGREALRVTVPGGYLLAFGGTRTHHRLVCGLEDAGWIIRDELDWIYASGFPKGKANLKPAHEPIVLARKPGPLRMLNIDGCRIPSPDADLEAVQRQTDPSTFSARGAGHVQPMYSPTGRWPSNLLLTDPVFDGGVDGVVGGGQTEVAKDWGPSQGKLDPTSINRTHPPGHHPVLYGDTGTYSRFFELPKGGRSGMLSGCHICGAPIAEAPSTGRTQQPDTAPPSAATPQSESREQLAFDAVSPSPSPGTATARSRAATPLDGTPAPTDPVAARTTAPGTNRRSRSSRREASLITTSPSLIAASPAAESEESTATTTITASPWLCASCVEGVTLGSIPLPPSLTGRALLPVELPNYPTFYICPKADRTDREPVLRGQLEEREFDVGDERPSGSSHARLDGRVPPMRENAHPTVKPIELMRHLVRLVTPSGGTVLDPFLGSGTTAIACEMEGFAWIGIEKEAEYVAIAEARLNGVQKGLGLPA